MRLLSVVLAGLLLATACSDSNGSSDASPESSTAAPTAASSDVADESASDGGANDADDRFPDVIAATAEPRDDGTWSFAATISSPYDSPERYADAWRVLTPDGEELGIRILTHHHASEQPFTRSLAGVSVPDGISTVTIEGRDLVNGWGGDTVDIVLEGDSSSG